MDRQGSHSSKPAHHASRSREHVEACGGPCRGSGDPHTTPGQPVVGVSAGEHLSSRGQSRKDLDSQAEQCAPDIACKYEPLPFRRGRGGKGQRDLELEVDQGHGQISDCRGVKG